MGAKNRLILVLSTYIFVIIIIKKLFSNNIKIHIFRERKHSSL